MGGILGILRGNGQEKILVAATRKEPRRKNRIDNNDKNHYHVSGRRAIAADKFTVKFEQTKG